MQILFQLRLKKIFLLLLTISLFSCSKEKLNLNELNETIFVRHKGADMPAYIHGNGSEKVFLIILHGGPGGNGLVYKTSSIGSQVEKNNVVVYFDQRGSGNSQGNYSKEDLNVNTMAEDVIALAKVIKAKYGQDSKLFLMGHSWGGTLGPATLLKNQSLFSGWIDVAGSHDPKGTYDAYKTFFTNTANEQIGLGNSLDFWQNLLDLTQNVGSEFSPEDFITLNKDAHKTEEILIKDGLVFEATSEGSISQNELTLKWNSMQATLYVTFKSNHYETVSFTERLKEINLPSIVLWGKYDLVVPTLFAQEAYDNLGSVDKEMFIFENSAHSPMFNEPDLFADKVIGFINKHK